VFAQAFGVTIAARMGTILPEFAVKSQGKSQVLTHSPKIRLPGARIRSA